MQRYLAILGALIVSVGLMAPAVLHAATSVSPTTQNAKVLIKGSLTQTGQTAGYGSKGIFIIGGEILKALFGVLGIIFFIILLYGGFLWMTDQGDGKQVERAKDILRSSIIGLIIVVVSYAFTAFVINRLQQAAGI